MQPKFALLKLRHRRQTIEQMKIQEDNHVLGERQETKGGRREIQTLIQLLEGICR